MNGMGNIIFNIFIIPIIMFISANSNLFAEFKDSEDNKINNQNGEQENDFNFEKNNYFLLIEKNLEKNKYYAAQKLLDDFNAKYPHNQEKKFYYYSAIVDEFKGEFLHAILNYQKAIDICPECSQARNNLGCLYLALGKYAESEEQLLKAIEANPYSPFINYNLGNLYYKIGKFDTAIKYLEKACKYKANFGEAFNKLGLIMYNMKNYSKALYNFDKALVFNYIPHKTHYNIGLSYYKLGQTDLAISNLKKAVNIKKDFYKAILELGKIHQIYKEYKTAIKYFLIAESINFEDINIRILIAECYNEMKRYDDAIDIIERLIKQDVSNNKLIELLIKIKEKKYSEIPDN